MDDLSAWGQVFGGAQAPLRRGGRLQREPAAPRLPGVPETHAEAVGRELRSHQGQDKYVRAKSLLELHARARRVGMGLRTPLGGARLRAVTGPLLGHWWTACSAS